MRSVLVICIGNVVYSSSWLMGSSGRDSPSAAARGGGRREGEKGGLGGGVRRRRQERAFRLCGRRGSLRSAVRASLPFECKVDPLLPAPRGDAPTGGSKSVGESGGQARSAGGFLACIPSVGFREWQGSRAPALRGCAAAHRSARLSATYASSIAFSLSGPGLACGREGAEGGRQGAKVRRRGQRRKSRVARHTVPRKLSRPWPRAGELLNRGVQSEERWTRGERRGMLRRPAHDRLAALPGEELVGARGQLHIHLPRLGGEVVPPARRATARCEFLTAAGGQGSTPSGGVRKGTGALEREARGERRVAGEAISGACR